MNKRKSFRRKTIHKGGSEIPNYALNKYDIDPNYIQVSSRNIVQQGSGTKSKKRVKGGGNLDFAAIQLTNPITNFASFYTGPASTAYVQPIGQSNYTGNMVNYR